MVNHYDTIRFLEGLGKVTDFTVPLVFAPNGIQKLNRQDLLNLLEQLDQADTVPELSESTALPL